VLRLHTYFRLLACAAWRERRPAKTEYVHSRVYVDGSGIRLPANPATIPPSQVFFMVAARFFFLPVQSR